MARPGFCVVLAGVVLAGAVSGGEPFGELLPGRDDGTVQPVPTAKGDAIVIRAARNESEAAQFIIRPTRRGGPGANFIHRTKLIGPGGAVIAPENIDIFRVGFTSKVKTVLINPHYCPDNKGENPGSGLLTQTSWLRHNDYPNR